MSTVTDAHTEQVRAILKKAGLSESTELDADQLARANEADSSWSPAKLHKYVMKGEAEAKATRVKDPKDEKFATIAAEAMTLAGEKGKKLGSPISAAQARVVRETLTRKKLTPAKMFEGKATVEQLKAYAHGGKQSELPEEARGVLREVCKATNDRRIWPRKVVSLVLIFRAQ